jgi:Fic family protein
MEKASPRLWILLGEVASKIEHLAQAPLKPGLAKDLMKAYLIKGALATTAIEGNTLTEDQVRRIMDGKLQLPKSQAYLGMEVDNIIAACNKMASGITRGKVPPLTPERIMDLNAQVLKGLSLEEDVVPGKIRKHSVTVGRYLGAPAEDCTYLLEKLCNWLPELSSEDADFKAPFAIIQAIVAHIYMAWIHPFGDGNGRTARLLEFQLLVQSGVPAVAAHLLSNHYNLTRADYYRQLDAASRSGGDIVPFVEYAAQGLADGLRDQIGQIAQQQIDLAWRDYIHEQIFETPSSTNERRYDLVKFLSRQPNPTKPHAIIDLSPRLAIEYQGKTKTLARDINALIDMELLERTAKGVRARIEHIYAFLPSRKRS